MICYCCPFFFLSCFIKKKRKLFGLIKNWQIFWDLMIVIFKMMVVVMMMVLFCRLCFHLCCVCFPMVLFDRVVVIFSGDAIWEHTLVWLTDYNLYSLYTWWRSRNVRNDLSTIFYRYVRLSIIWKET